MPNGDEIMFKKLREVLKDLGLSKWALEKTIPAPLRDLYNFKKT